jgi:hypothetical protein
MLRTPLHCVCTLRSPLALGAFNASHWVRAVRSGLPLRIPAGVHLSDGSTLSAQLVVDCLGRGSNMPAWLADAGCNRPRTTRVNVDGGYAAW